MIADVHFANEQLGLGVHFDNTEVYRTTNGGQTWNVVATGGDLRRPLFLSESVALVPNLLGQLRRSMARSDFDGDGDCALIDFDLFQLAFTGALST